MGRAPCCSKVGLHRGPWTPREDTLLTKYIQAHGEGHWRSMPKKAGNKLIIKIMSCSYYCYYYYYFDWASCSYLNFIRVKLITGHGILIFLHLFSVFCFSFLKHEQQSFFNSEFQFFFSIPFLKSVVSFVLSSYFDSLSLPPSLSTNIHIY